MNGIVGLLLAAGSSRRFGSDKLLHALPDGGTIVTASACALAATTDRCVALIRPGLTGLRAALANIGIDILEVTDAEAGMGVTLATGVQATASAAGWVVALGDMPCVQTATVHAVVAALRRGASITAPFYQGKRGHPVGFSGHWRDALSALKGDAGARSLLEANADILTRIEVTDPGCLFDVDTPEDVDLQNIIKAYPHILNSDVPPFEIDEL